jgi:hypothetical protein
LLDFGFSRSWGRYKVKLRPQAEEGYTVTCFDNL